MVPQLVASVSSFNVVESWTEWDTLRETFVGTLEQKNLGKAEEPHANFKARQGYERYQWPLRNGLPDAECLAEAKDQLENFISVLKGEGIVVTRPTGMFPTEQAVKTPLFSVDRMGGFTCPRDIFFVAGRQVIEAPMSWRSRYFENLAWRDLMLSYFTADPRMRWTCAPKPKMADTSFVAGGADAGKITNDEIFFDAADSRRFGKDVFFQAHYGTANHRGRDWVRRELAASGLRVYDAEFEQYHHSHFDARLTPVDEGLAFHGSMDKPGPAMMELFKENEWNLIDVGHRTDCRSAHDNCAPGIHLNVLTIAPGVVIVEENEKKFISAMKAEGCDVIPVPFSAAYQFGGSLNCFTLDIFRQGPAAKCYFPTLDRKAEQDAAAGEVRAEAERQRLSAVLPPATKRSRKSGPVQ